MVDLSVLVQCACSGVIAFAGAWFTFSNRLTRLETKIDILSEQVKKHNGIVERTYKLESDVKTMWLRHDELKGDVHSINEKIN